MQADVLQAQVELGNYLDRLLQWRQQQDSLKAELNALRNRPATATINRPAALRPRQFTLKLDDVMAMLESRPQMKALKTQIDKQQKAVALARKEFYPDFNVGVDYGFRENTPTGQFRPDFFTSYISLNVPIWFKSKQLPRLREEQAKQSAAENAYQAAWNELGAAVKDRVNKLERLNQQIQLYVTGITPQAEQAAAASLTAYQVGSLEFARLVQNQIAVYQTELKLQEYLKDFEHKLGRSGNFSRAGIAPAARRKIMSRTSYSTLIGGVLLGLVLALGAAAVFYFQGYRFMRHENLAAKPERQILCYKSLQDPNFISDKPGKDPQGNELIPVYSESAPASTVAAKPQGERKIKYWYSPMDPGYVRGQTRQGSMWHGSGS